MRSAARLLKLGLDTDPVTATRLLKEYLSHNGHSSPGSIVHARRLFDRVPSKDVILWTVMISAYAQSHQPAQGLHLLSEMHRHREGILPNHYTYASAARAAGALSDQKLARTIHGHVIVRGFQSNVVVGTSILDMYSKCNHMALARRVFDEMPERNAVAWNSMISGYVTGGLGMNALYLFCEMRCVEFEEADEYAVASVLTACAGIGEIGFGLQIHGYLIKVGFEEDPAIKNAAGNMYFRCGEAEFATQVMEGREGVLSKLIMVKGYAFNGRYADVIRIISGGVNFLGIVARDYSVVVAVLSACANHVVVRIGRQVHGLIITLGYYQNDHSTGNGSENRIIGSTLIDMYFRCFCVEEANTVFHALVKKDLCHWNSMVVGSIHNGLIHEARRFFSEMPERNAISWTAMISGYARNHMAEEGLLLLPMACKECGMVEGKSSILAVALDACSCLAALDVGKQLHAWAIRTITKKINNNILLNTSLVDMYSKSGDLNYARKVFDRMDSLNVVSWTSMITAYSAHGSAFEALRLFEEISKTDMKPNEVTFIAVLSACNHSGLVEEGVRYFKMMKDIYGIDPRSDHCACLVDLLARAGRLSEAWSLVEGFKNLERGNQASYSDVKDRNAIWGALASGCRLHGNMEIGSKVAREILYSKHQSSDVYLALSNVYAAAGIWGEVYNVREKWRRDCVVHEPGFSRIQSRIVA